MTAATRRLRRGGGRRRRAVNRGSYSSASSLGTNYRDDYYSDEESQLSKGKVVCRRPPSEQQQQQRQLARVLRQPEEVLVQILAFLDARGLGRFEACCRSLTALAGLGWREYVARRWTSVADISKAPRCPPTMPIEHVKRVARRLPQKKRWPTRLLLDERTSAQELIRDGMVRSMVL
jgi:hypothetical protein